MNDRRRAIMGIAKSGGGLPSAYQEVEYLESTGEQYIDTLFSVNSNSCLEIEGYFSHISGRTRDGARIDIMTAAFNFMSVASDYMRIDYGTQQLTDLPKDMLYLKLDGKNNAVDIVYADNTQSSISLQQQTFATGLNYYLFSLNNNGQVQFSSERITACKLSDNGLLFRNFVPCYRKADNKAGLYDTVNDIFYTNANTSASQDFIVGLDV